MMTIILIPCSNKKTEIEEGEMIPARDLYAASALFKKTLKYAEQMKPDKIYILSDKYNVVELNELRGNYDKDLRKESLQERKKWAQDTLEQLQKKGCQLEKDTFIFLTGEIHYENLIPSMRKHQEPMKGLKIGEKLHWLNERIK